MPGREGLGRDFNDVPTAAGVGLSLRHASAVCFVVHGVTVAAQVTITVAPSFGGTYVSPGAVISHYYTSTAANGSVARTKAVQTNSNLVPQTGTIAIGATAEIEVLAAMLPDPNCYIKCSVTTGTALVTAIMHDLLQQRGPANLALAGA